MQPWRIGPWRLMRSSTCSVWGWCFFGCQRSWGFSLNLEKILYNTLNGNPLQNLTFCAFFCSNPCRHLCGWRWWYTMLAICQQFLRPGCWKKQPCAVNGIIMEAVPAGVWSVWIFCRRWPCREKCEICLLQHCPAGHQLWQDDCTKRQAEQLRHDNSSRPSEPRQTLKNFEIFKVQKACKQNFGTWCWPPFAIEALHMGAPERQPVWIPGTICCGLHFLFCNQCWHEQTHTSYSMGKLCFASCSGILASNLDFDQSFSSRFVFFLDFRGLLCADQL